MRILWLSNTEIAGLDSGGSGSWLRALAQRLIASGQVALGNIATGDVRQRISRDYLPLRQWLVPDSFPGRNGFPPRHVVEDVLRAIDDFSPDLIHVWGVEAWWGLLNALGQLRQPVLLEMQGVKGLVSRVFAGGLSLAEQRRCRGPKEWLLGRSIEKERCKFADWGRFEREIVAGCRHVATQTPWVEAWVRANNPGCNIYRTNLALRREFYEAGPWGPAATSPVLFCSAAYPVPYKGIHDAIRALALLVRRFPEMRLRIAGAQQKPGFRQDGYVRWLNRLCRDAGVAEQVDWLGALPAEQIVQECQKCSVFIMPSHIENCCTAMQEALYLGVPTVSAYAGGVPSLAREEIAALYFPPGDEAMCAYQVERLLSDQALAARLSSNARTVALERNNPVTVVANQLEIYRQVLAAEAKR